MDLEQQLKRLTIANKIIHAEYMWAANRMLELKMDVEALQDVLATRGNESEHRDKQNQHVIDTMQEKIKILIEDNNMLNRRLRESCAENGNELKTKQALDTCGYSDGTNAITNSI
jgi:hypothetical protein